MLRCLPRFEIGTLSTEGSTGLPGWNDAAVRFALATGLCLNGHLFKGALSKPGEIGHMIIEANGRQCPCGNRGCLEHYVSLQAAFEFFDASLKQAPSSGAA